MKYDGILKGIEPDDLKQPYDKFAEILGVERLYEFAKEYGGTYLYIPNVKSLIKDTLYKKIKAESKKHSARHLAGKYGVSESTVRKIINSKT